MRSIIITGSVALGVLAGLFILSLYAGMIESRVRTVIEDEVSHIQLHHPAFKKDYQANYTIGGSDELMAELLQMEEIDRLSSRMIARGMLATATGSAGVEIRGVQPDRENEVARMREKIVEGAYFSADGKNELLVGKSLAEKKGLKLRSKVVLTFTNKDQVITSGAFRIAGIYRSTNAALDERLVYVRQADLAPLLDVGEAVHEIAIVLKEDGLLDATYRSLRAAYPQLLTETWKEIAPETELMVSVFDQTGFIILVIIMVTLGFGIMNTMR